VSPRLFIILIFILSSAVLGADHNYIGSLADSADAIEPDPSRQAKVENLLLERAGVRFLLEKGVVTLSETIRGRVVGASFVGKGRFQMVPPNRIEKFALAKLCKDSTADWEFGSALFLFTDSTAIELLSKLDFDSLDAEVGKHFDLYDRCIKYVEKEFQSSFPAWLLPGLLQPHFPGSFMVDFECAQGRMFFLFEPNEVEEVQLWKHARTSDGSYPELVSSFHSPDQYAHSKWGPEHEDKDLIDSLDYFLDVQISQSSDAKISAELSFIPRVDSLRSLYFRIYSKLVEESIVVLNVVGDTLYWDKLKDEGTITVYFNEPLPLGERAGLKFSYSSKRLIQQTPWGSPYLEGATTWYPRYGHMTRAKHRLRFSCPEHYTMLSVGTKLSERVEDDQRITEWDMSEYPVAVVSFNYGAFERDTALIYGGIPLEVYGGKSHGAFSGKLREAVLLDLAASASIFSAELAPYPFDKLWATEIPAAHGQGLPGLLHLSWASFDMKRAGYTDAFVAHEVAHQWWGHILGWDSYHDQWLSEGFAEYMAGWYIKRKYQDSKLYRNRFQEMVEEWREDILESGGLTRSGHRTVYKEGNDAGPIWLGRRLVSSASADYFTLVYSKGAYVLYMLRMLMYDFVNHDESRFIDMLKDFLASYYWQEAATSDFVRIAEKHYGSGLGWFFEQYVYDTQIPNYYWRAEFSETGDGRYQVTFDIETRDVGENFEILVPVTIGMENDYHTTTRLRIDALQKRITLPTLPYRPEKVIFNTYNSVLCKSHQVD
jgi:hypothetical protein